MIKKLFQPIIDARDEEQKNLIWLCLSYFFVLFNYPFLRATTTAMYMQAYGGSASPVIWLYSVVALTGIIFIYNKLHSKIGVHALFYWTSAVSIVIFLSALFFLNQGITWMSGVLYVWKEVYIVILVHLILGYCNSFLTLDKAKLFFGPLGAMGSVGGIVGGAITSTYSKKWGVDAVIYMGCLGLVINILTFSKTIKTKAIGTSSKDDSQIPPLTAISSVKNYVWLIALIIAMSQFCINIMNLEFDLAFARIVPDQSLKASYLGTLFSLINVATLIIQFLIIPPLFKYKSNRFSQYLIPTSYIFLTLIGMSIGSTVLISVAGAFLLMKAFDYSLFTASKELLYYPLTTSQKYGAKYIGDMVVYRLSKGVIAIILIKFQDIGTLNVLMAISIGIWLLALSYLFTVQKHLKEVVL